MSPRRVFDVLHREVRGLHEAAYLLAFFALGSQLFALIRDRLLAHNFGASETLDIFYAAFRIPDTLYALIASLVSLFVLIPFLEAAQHKGKAAVQRFLSDMFTFFAGALAIVGAAAWIFAPQLVAALYGGFSAESQVELVVLVRVLLLQPLFLGVSNLLASYVQIQGRFLLYATAPILYNFGIIIGILVFYPVLGISGLAWGVVLGALFHLAIQVPFIVKEGVWPTFVRPDWGRVLNVVRISIPRTLTLSAQQLVILALVSLASLFAAGSVASFSLAWNLQAVPLALIGVSYSVAAFPKLARLFGAGEHAEYQNMILAAARQIIFWALPATVLVVVLRAQIVRVILGTGAFDWDATMMTGAVLALLVVSLAAQSLVILLVRACYAAGKTAAPLILNVGSSILTVAVAVLLVQSAGSEVINLSLFAEVMRVGGLLGSEVLLIALAYSIGSIVNMLLLLGYFELQYQSFLIRLMRTTMQSIVASLFAGAATYLALDVLDDIVSLQTFVGVSVQGLGAGIVGVFMWTAVLVALGNEDIQSAWLALHKKMTRSRVEEVRGSIENS